MLKLSLEERINGSFVLALKAQDGLRKDVLKLLKASISNWKTDKGNIGKTITDKDIYKLVNSQIKMREEAIEKSKRYGTNPDEIHILREFLPRQLTDKELAELFENFILTEVDEDTNLKSAANKFFSDKYTGRYDSKKLNLLIDTQLKKS